MLFSGDISLGPLELDYENTTWVYFESSHGKGPHDAAGGMIKRQVDLAIMQGKTGINSAHDLCEYALECLQNPKSGLCTKRIFRYIGAVSRSVQGSSNQSKITGKDFNNDKTHY